MEIFTNMKVAMENRDKFYIEHSHRKMGERWKTTGVKELEWTDDMKEAFGKVYLYGTQKHLESIWIYPNDNSQYRIKLIVE